MVFIYLISLVYLMLLYNFQKSFQTHYLLILQLLCCFFYSKDSIINFKKSIIEIMIHLPLFVKHFKIFFPLMKGISIVFQFKLNNFWQFPFDFYFDSLSLRINNKKFYELFIYENFFNDYWKFNLCDKYLQYHLKYVKHITTFANL